MGSLKGVNILRGQLGPNDIVNQDAICGLLVTGVSIPSDVSNGILGLESGKTIKIKSLKEAESYGITAVYDQTNSLSVHRHISEFFRVAGEGYTLYVMLYTGEMTAAFGDQYAKRMIADSNGDIRVLAIAVTPKTDDATHVDGLPEDVRASIELAQKFYEWANSSFRPCQIILEGRDYKSVNATSALDLRGLTIEGKSYEAYKVSVCIGQDWKYADGLDAIRKKMADIGSMLGRLASIKPNENIAEVDGGDLMNVNKSAWLMAGLSNHKTIAEVDSDLELLDDKGYIFAIQYTGITGYYWNNDHTCTPIIRDKEGYFNEYTISYGRVMDKAVRNLRSALLPKVKSTQPVDPNTGRLPQTIVTYFERLSDSEVFDRMIAQGIITAGKTTIDQNSDLLIAPRVLNVSFVVVPTGQIDEIKGFINLKTSI